MGQKKADKKYKKKELGKANAMPKEHDPDTKKGQLNGTSVAKVEKKVKAQTKEIDSTGFEGGKKGKKAAGKKGDKKGEKKEEKKKELGKANEMPKEHDPDTKKGQLNGTAVAKTTKKVEK